MRDLGATMTARHPSSSAADGPQSRVPLIGTGAVAAALVNQRPRRPKPRSLLSRLSGAGGRRRRNLSIAHGLRQPIVGRHRPDFASFGPRRGGCDALAAFLCGVAWPQAVDDRAALLWTLQHPEGVSNWGTASPFREISFRPLQRRLNLGGNCANSARGNRKAALLTASCTQLRRELD